MNPREVVRPLLRVHQVREFTDAPVDTEAIGAIADAARWSGSSANTQPWRFVVIREPDVLRRLAESGLPHTRSLTTAAAAVAIVLPQVKGAAVSNAFDEGRAAERILIAEDEPTIVGYDEPEYARRLHYERPIASSLAVLRGVRAASLDLLESLTPAEWDRRGTHTESGAYSVDGWLEIYASHSHDHAEQIRAARVG